jgi:RNA polymerase sigma-70 factor (ECF subfamily)
VAVPGRALREYRRGGGAFSRCRRTGRTALVSRSRMDDIASRLREQVLVLRCQAGDDDAFRELVEVFHGRLRDYIDQVLAAPNDAEDILQEVWFAVYRKLVSLRDPKAIRRWLYRIVRNKIAHRLRRARVRSEPLEAHDLAERGDAEPAFSDEDLRLLSECLDKLSAEHREVLLLRFMENMSYEEIATAIHCRLGTVRSRLHYSKRALKQELERRRNGSDQ